MLFPTFTFAVFFLVTYGAHTLTRPRRASSATPWKLTMLVASYVFYGWWDWRFLLLIAGASLFNWAAARGIVVSGGRRRRALVVGAVAVNLGVLGFFKYWGFFVESLIELFGADQPLPFLDIVLPVGISFYTFQAISYVVDVHRDDVAPAPLLDVGLFLAFFPQLVAGPIVRAKEFLPQLDRAPRGSDVEVTTAIWLIGRGLFKKVVIATYLADAVVDPVFDAPTAATRLETLQATYGYAIQIYADFSGYTDIAIGIALLLGFRFPENFNDPYRATSIREFWRRWHITLSTWLRDYLYIPLGGSRRGRIFTYRNLALTMLLGGLWHRAAWRFVLWGAIHGFALVVERMVVEWRTGRGRAPWSSKRVTVMRWLLTLHVVCLAWIPFRAETLDQAIDMVRGLASGPIGGGADLAALGLIGAALAVQVAPSGWFEWVRNRLAATDPLVQGVAFGCWIALIAALGPEGVAPFIYFQF